MVTDPNKKLTPAEAAKRLGVAKSHLANLRSTGGGPPYFKIGNRIIYAVGDLDTWLATKRTTETPKAKTKKRPARRSVEAPAPSLDNHP